MKPHLSYNCQIDNHGGCNEFHLGCICPHHPLGKHLTPAGRYSFVDVDTYPSATVEELEEHEFYDAQAKEKSILKATNALTEIMGEFAVVEDV